MSVKGKCSSENFECSGNFGTFPEHKYKPQPTGISANRNEVGFVGQPYKQKKSRLLNQKSVEKT